MREEHTQTRILKNLPNEFVLPGNGNRPSGQPQPMLVSAADRQRFMLDKEYTRIGRSQENDIVIDHGRISRRHAEITKRGQACYIADKGSSNGVWLNGKKITEPTRLAFGDRILIAEQEYLFTQES